MSLICEYCSSIYNTKYYLFRYYKSESCQKIINHYNNSNNEKNKDLLIL